MASIPEDELRRMAGRDRLAKIIKDARRQRGDTLRAFGERIGIAHGTVARLESAGSDASDEVLAALAELLPYTFVELKVISLGVEVGTVREFASAHDVFEVAKGLERPEQIQLMHMLLDNTKPGTD